MDTGVLGKVVHPRAAEARNCLQWLHDLLASGVRVCIPEISDYELRRKLLHMSATAQLRRLDDLGRMAEYVPIDTAAMQKAAALWARARLKGTPSAPPEAIDGDVILSAQAILTAQGDEELTVATTDVGDLSNYVSASTWNAISI